MFERTVYLQEYGRRPELKVFGPNGLEKVNYFGKTTNQH